MKFYQFVYDNFPYLLFALSGYLLLFHDLWPLRLSAAMFYGIGCIILVSRSATARLDAEKHLKMKHRVPEVVYEYAPYWYAATAVFLLMAFEMAIVQFVAFILIVLAIRNLILRHSNRTKAPSKF